MGNFRGSAGRGDGGGNKAGRCRLIGKPWRIRNVRRRAVPAAFFPWQSRKVLTAADGLGRLPADEANVAQLAELRIRNAMVDGSNPPVGSIFCPWDQTLSSSPGPFFLPAAHPPRTAAIRPQPPLQAGITARDGAGRGEGGVRGGGEGGVTAVVALEDALFVAGRHAGSAVHAVEAEALDFDFDGSVPAVFEGVGDEDDADLPDGVLVGGDGGGGAGGAFAGVPGDGREFGASPRHLPPFRPLPSRYSISIERLSCFSMPTFPSAPFA